MYTKSDYYNFIPYKYGAYSFQLAQDIGILENHGYLIIKDKKIYGAFKKLEFSEIFAHAIDILRGNSLIRKSYNEFPYYAINSKVAERLVSQLVLQKIQQARDELIQKSQMLFTIGYEGKTVENFVNILIKNNIAVLCDVRKNPISRKFGFSKNKLKHIIETIGIKYIHIPELGIKTEKRKKLQNLNDYEELFADYRKTLSLKQEELQYVYSILKTHNRVALMCYEQDPRFCHRGQVKDYISEHYKVKSEDL